MTLESAVSILIVSLLICGGFGMWSASLAKEKGRSPSAWFWVGALFGLIGVLIAAVVGKVEPVQSGNTYIDTAEGNALEGVRLDR